MASAARGEPDEKQSGGLFLVCEQHMARTPHCSGTVQRVVESARASLRERPVVASPGLYELTDKKNFVVRADLLNRPLRTRTVGVWGLGARNPWLPDQISLQIVCYESLNAIEHLANVGFRVFVPLAVRSLVAQIRPCSDLFLLREVVLVRLA